MNITCPIDNKDDSIQKVSAVIVSGKSTGTFLGSAGSIESTAGYTTLIGSSTSHIVLLLALPPRPQPIPYPRQKTILAFLLAFVGGIGIFVFLLFIATSISSIISSIFNDVNLNTKATLLTGIFFSIGFLFYGVIFVLSMFIFYSYIIHTIKENKRVN